MVNCDIGWKWECVRSQRLLFRFVHPLGCAGSVLGRAAKSGVVATCPATVFQFGDVTFGMPHNCDGGLAALASVGAN